MKGVSTSGKFTELLESDPAMLTKFVSTVKVFDGIAEQSIFKVQNFLNEDASS